jgi:hypothetical protein
MSRACNNFATILCHPLEPGRRRALLVGMWLGLLHLSAGESDACDGDDTILLLAWEAGRKRPFTVGGPITAVPDLARLLRQAAEQAPLLPPRCDACGKPFDLPLD